MLKPLRKVFPVIICVNNGSLSCLWHFSLNAHCKNTMHNCSGLLNTINGGETGAGETGARRHFSQAVGIYLHLCPLKYLKN